MPEVLASMRTMLAAGAMAWAHSTSRAISLAQPASVLGSLVVLPVWLTTGYRTALLSADPAVHGLLQTAPHVAGIPIIVHLPAFAIVMLITVLLLQGARESVTVNNVMVVIKLLALGGLWWMFVRDPQVGTDADAAAQHLAAPAPDQGEPR